MSIHVSVICSAEAECLALSAPDLLERGMVITTQLGNVDSLADVLLRDQPDVVLLELADNDSHGLETIAQALCQAPATHLVLVSAEHSEAFLLRAMRAGVREVMAGPMSPLTVQLAVKHARLNTTVSNRRVGKRGKVIALIPAKGGAGATFLATNLAYTLSKMDKRLLVLDLNMYFGDASVFLGDKAAVSNVIELASQVQRLDAILLRSAIIPLSENLHILPAPELPEDISKVSIQGIEKIIEIARNQYDFVVIDISSSLDEVALRALDLADVIYIAMQLSLTFIRAAKHMVRVFQSRGYTRDKLELLVNRYESGGTIDLGDVESATMRKVSLTIPNSHFAVTESINQGIPLPELAPRDRVSRAIRDWAAVLVPTASAPKPRGWLHKLIRTA